MPWNETCQIVRRPVRSRRVLRVLAGAAMLGGGSLYGRRRGSAVPGRHAAGARQLGSRVIEMLRDARAQTGWSSVRARRLLAVYGAAALIALAVVGQAAASSSQLALNSSTCAKNLGGSWHGATCTVSSRATLGSNQTLTVPSGITLSITYAASDDSAGLTANGTIVNNGTISIVYSGTGGEGLLSTGAFTNKGMISISDTGQPDYSNTNAMCESSQYFFCGGYGVDSSGVVTNLGTITANESGGFDTRALFTSGTLSNAGVMSLTVGSAGSGSTGWTNNAGAITNTGTIHFAVPNPNDGVDGIYNFLGTISDSGKIDGTGSAYGEVENDAGTITIHTHGVITLNASTYGGGLLNEDGATLTVERGGDLEIAGDGTGLGLWNTGNGAGGTSPEGLAYPNKGTTVDNSGSVTVQSQGTIQNDNSTGSGTGVATITNESIGTITNGSGGTISNLSTIDNFGTIDNSGTINNSGTFNENGTCSNMNGGTGCI